MPKGHFLRKRLDVVERLTRNSIPLPETGCWIWMGAIFGKGYGYITRTGKAGSAGLVHRVSYERFKGEIPKGSDVHHICEVRCCWNPEHLITLPRPEHGLYHTPKGRRFKRTACPHCGIVGSVPAMRRWHFDKCKSINKLKE